MRPTRWSWKMLALMMALAAHGAAPAAPKDTALAERVAMLRDHIAELQRLAQVASGAGDAEWGARAELDRHLVAANQAAVAAKEDVRGIRLRLFPNATDDATEALDSLALSLDRAQDAFMSLRTAARAGDRQAVGLAVGSVANVSIDLANGFKRLSSALEKQPTARAGHDTTGDEQRNDRAAY